MQTDELPKKLLGASEIESRWIRHEVTKQPLLELGKAGKRGLVRLLPLEADELAAFIRATSDGVTS